MKTTFNIQRIGLLLQRHFILRKHREIIHWSILLFFFILIGFNAQLVGLLIILSGICYIYSLQETQSNKSGTNYLMIPASQIEKIIALLLIGIIYCFIMSIIMYAIANILVFSIDYLIMGEGTIENVYPSNWELFSPSGKYKWLIMFLFIDMEYPPYFLQMIVFMFAFFQSAFILGCLYFKRNAFVKTILCCLGIWLFIVINHFLILKLSDKIGEWNMFSDINSNNFILLRDVSMYSQLLLLRLSILIFSVTAYVRLTEKQI